MRTRIGICLFLLMICGSAGQLQAESGPDWKTFEQYAEQGDSDGKKIYIHFWAVWCQYCHQMQTDTFADPSVAAALNKDFYPIKVDTDKEPLVAGMFGVKGLPYNLFLTENGRILAHRPGYVPPDTFLKILHSVIGIEPR